MFGFTKINYFCAKLNMLSKKTQYSLLALLALTREYNNGPVLISKISNSNNIPQKFLESILLELKKNGFVNSKKGKGGGYYLLKSPENISLADVIRLFEGAIALLPCAANKYYEPCPHTRDEDLCGLRCVFKELRDETVKILKGYNLQQIINKEEMLKNK